MHIIIPAWFYPFDSAMYFISSLIGFLLSFYFHRMYSISSEKKHMYLHLGFLLLSIALLTLSVTDMFSYTVYIHCQSYSQNCNLGLLDEAFSLDDYTYLIYFGLSILAYALFVIAYAEEYLRFSRILVFAFIGYLVVIVTLIPIQEADALWYHYHEYFHLTAMMMMLFISFRNFINYTETKNSNGLLVAFSFASISLFHLFHLFAFASGWMYVFGHMSLLAGFLALLAMVVRVSKG